MSQPEPTTYRINAKATIPASADELVVIGRRDLNDLVQRAAQDAWRSASEQLVGTYFEMAYDALAKRGMIVSPGERERIEQQATERAVRAMLAETGGVQKVAIVELPPMDAKVERDSAGRIKGLVGS